MENQLQICEGQVLQLQELIDDDPENESLIQLKEKLKTTIAILKERIQLENEPSDDCNVEADSLPSWSPGQSCLAPRLFDQKYAAASVLRVDEDYGDCWVQWKHPRRRYEVACRWELQGKCRSETGECKFSHGVWQRVASLRPFPTEKESELLSEAGQVNAEVLVKYRDGIWYDATVDAVMDEEDGAAPFVMVHFDGFGEHEDHFKVPLLEDHIICRRCIGELEEMVEETETRDDLSTTSFGSELSDAESDPEYEVFAPRVLSDSRHNQEFLREASVRGLFEDAYMVADWEKHTKGIGSKLLSKMGYIRGDGLGKDKTGITRPIPIRILPAGVGLDFLDKINPKSSSETSGKKRKRNRARQNAVPKEDSDMFSLLNTKIAPHHNQDSSSKSQKRLSSNMAKEDLQRHMLISRDQQVELNKKIKKLEESLERNKDQQNFAQQLQNHIKKARSELAYMQSKSIRAEEALNEKRNKKKQPKDYF